MTMIGVFQKLGRLLSSRLIHVRERYLCQMALRIRDGLS
jgi:hypothetical protein